MRKRLLLTIATLAIAGLTAGAVPAFTADNGTVTVSITAQGAAAPCIEFATPPGTSVNFGTKAFSRLNAPSTARGDITPRFRNCGTADENISISGTDATAPSATWTLDPGFNYTCPASAPRNTYLIAYFLDNNPVQFIGKTPAALIGSSAPGANHDLILDWFMPCEGSNGAGQTFSASIVLTAAIA